MKRRAFIALLGSAVIVRPLVAAPAPRAGRRYRVGVLSPGTGVIERIRRTTLPELARLGFSEASNLALEIRSGTREQLPALARELAASRPEVVIAVSAAAIRAMRHAATATPIVGAFIGEDPIAAGFATSLAHPGGTITGIVMLAPELDAKRLHLLREAIPGSRRIAVLAVSAARDAPNLAAVREAAQYAGVELVAFYAAKPDDYRSIFAAMRGAGADALEIISAPEFYSDASRLAALAAETGLPTVCEWAEMARSGCLLGYGPDFTELQHRVAEYVARILLGASPGELPIEGPTHYEFAVNLKTAKVLGLSIPPSILDSANEVIE